VAKANSVQCPNPTGVWHLRYKVCTAETPLGGQHELESDEAHDTADHAVVATTSCTHISGYSGVTQQPLVQQAVRGWSTHCRLQHTSRSWYDQVGQCENITLLCCAPKRGNNMLYKSDNSNQTIEHHKPNKQWLWSLLYHIQAAMACVAAMMHCKACNCEAQPDAALAGACGEPLAPGTTKCPAPWHGMYSHSKQAQHHQPPLSHSPSGLISGGQ